jgi:hypothetical protein
MTTERSREAERGAQTIDWFEFLSQKIGRRQEAHSDVLGQKSHPFSSLFSCEKDNKKWSPRRMCDSSRVKERR